MVTSLIAGHDDFIQAVRERVSAMQVIQFYYVYYMLIIMYVLKWGDLLEMGFHKFWLVPYSVSFTFPPAAASFHPSSIGKLGGRPLLALGQ